MARDQARYKQALALIALAVHGSPHNNLAKPASLMSRTKEPPPVPYSPTSARNDTQQFEFQMNGSVDEPRQSAFKGQFN